MASFLERMFGRGSGKGSSATAKDRLQFVLVHDRINLPPEKLREMKEEILAVISKYVSVDRDHVDIALEQRDRDTSKLVAQVPFARGGRMPAAATPEKDEDEDLKQPPASKKEDTAASAAKPEETAAKTEPAEEDSKPAATEAVQETKQETKDESSDGQKDEADDDSKDTR